MAHAAGTLVLPSLGLLAVVFAVSVPVAIVYAVVQARRAARDEGAAPATLAVVALALVRVWLTLLLIAAPFTLLGLEDRSLGDRLEFQEYGYGVPIGGGKIEEHGGPWLVLHHDTDVRVCTKQSRPYPSNDPPVFAGQAVCPAAENLRKTYGDVDVDSLRLVRQIEKPDSDVEPRMNLLLWAGFATFLLGVVALERILKLTVDRRPFSPAAVRWLRVLAAAVAGVTVVVPTLTDRFVDELIRRYFNDAAVAGMDQGVTINLGALLVVLLILVLAEVWRLGIRFQSDAEGVV